MIETNNYLIRKFSIDDAEDMYNNWASDPFVTKYLTWETHENIQVTLNYLNSLIESKDQCYAIVDKKSGNLIGSIGKVNNTSNFKMCEVGYCLSRSYQHKGVMQEVLLAFLNYLFEKENYEFVSACYVKENRASGHVMLKCGMYFVYNNKEIIPKLGEVELYHYEISKEAYKCYRLKKEIENFFSVSIPTRDTKMMLEYLTNTDFIVKQYLTMLDDELIVKKNKSIFCYVEKNLNIGKVFIIAKINNQEELKSYLNIFEKDNYNSIITSNNKCIAKVLFDELNKHNLTISFAESCTGGKMADTLISVPGASSVINESLVTYSEEAKVKYLNVKKSTLSTYSVYSREVAEEMVRGLYLKTSSNVCASITGLAGGANASANDGSFDFGIYLNIDNKKELKVIHQKENGNREEVRIKQTNFVFFNIIKMLRMYYKESFK